MSKCSIDGCDKVAVARSWCDKHYKRWQEHGDPLAIMIRPFGTGTLTHEGYHVRTENGVTKKEHVRIAEKALGKPLPAGAVVHHVDENRLNNDPSNLVICGRDFHMLLHARMRAMAETGDPNKRRCGLCKQYDALENLRSYTTHYWHQQCRHDYDKAHRITKAAALFHDKTLQVCKRTAS